METWELIPFKSVGPICFTDTKEDIIKKLGKPEAISRKGDCLIYDDFLIQLTENNKNIYSISPNPNKSCKILYDKVNLNVLEYKKIVKKLFRKGHKIYGDFSSFPIYTNKDIGTIFITHESDMDGILELDCLGIMTSDKDLYYADILITSEDQII